MSERFARARLLFQDNYDKLSSKKVLICGLGGVGGMCFSSLARVGINVSGIDKDYFEASNQNRQLHSENIGLSKASVFAEFYKANCYELLITKESFLEFLKDKEFDLVIDCIDDVKAKCDIAEIAYEKGISFISSGGAAKRIDPLKLKVANWDKTKMCALAKAVRLELKKRRFKGKFKMAYSEEEPMCVGLGSFMGMTASMGLLLSSLAIKQLLKN
ncbi:MULTISPECIES: ThiF family adenylyltransferase [unclassified Campylobacter]|uniref:tRNA threonylcarbamoyladenosine dehydratase n=1 Tax=unclassified Campylobacter TaxID=2593542 RepID=UPI001BD9D846|nr:MULTISPECIES: ThiF family adenylyltransferase [unclassified Campylobacter]MBT0881782.1 ThiF family adenylyltransferase [Campylobacter sp. 2018MI13]ULO02702.1 tRNA threonylcarbamoyladenosine dehydratase [Campylobacter sp. RM12651]